MKRKFWILIIIYLILMFADGLVTFINTPDLALEGNPLVSVWNLGWGGLFVANLLVFVLVFTLAYYSLIRYKTIIAPVKNRREYLSQILYNRPDKFIWSFYKLPKRWSPFFAMLGYGLIYMSIFNRAIIVSEWLCHNIHIPVYDDIRAIVPFGRMDILISIIFLFYLMIYWFNKEYKKSKTELINS